MPRLLDNAYKKIVLFLNKHGYQYLVIGGIAAGVLGEPRATGDIDIDIVLKKEDIACFLNKAGRTGFKINKKKCLEQINRNGVFQIGYADYHIDFIIASIALERLALQRKKIIRLYGVKAFFPTPEDFILLKVIPGRPQDLVDAQNVATRYRGKLDTKYILSSAQNLSEEAQDLRIWNTTKQIIGK